MFIRLLKAIIAAVLFIAVLKAVGLDELGEVLGKVELRYVVWLLLLSVVMIWASAAKWQTFIRAMGHEVRIGELMRLYTIGYFFNTFTPASVGGDVVRSVHLGGLVSSQRDALVATFLERFTGLLAMAALGAVSVLFGSGITAGLEAAILLVGAGTVVLALPCFSKRCAVPLFRLAQTAIRRLAPETVRPRCLRILDKLDQGMEAARNDRLLLMKGLLWSFLFHSLTVLNTLLAAWAVGWQDPPVAGLFVVVPLVLLVSMAPITPNGIGLQEGAFVFLLERIGGTRAQGLGTALILRAKVLVIALVGGALWAASSAKKKQPDTVTVEAGRTPI